MRTFTGFWALTLAGALAACGSSSSSGLPPSTPMVRLSDLNTSLTLAKPNASPLRGEVLSATNVKVKPRHPIPWGASFTASGEAKGPYPGTFAAKGHWAWSKVIQLIWSFSESFTITSGARKISGTVAGTGSLFGGPPMTDKTFGPVTKSGVLKYKSRIDGTHYSGSVTTNEIKSGSLGETLER